MILINKNSENTVALSLTNNVTITGSPVYFLFQFNNAQTGEEILFTGDDVSTNATRYNQFNFIETGITDANLLDSTINLQPNGWWNYKAYQMKDKTNLDLNGVTGGAIQIGKVYVNGTGTTEGQENIYTGQSTSQTIYYKR